MIKSRNHDEGITEIGLGAGGKDGIWIRTDQSCRTTTDSDKRIRKNNRWWWAMLALLAMFTPLLLFVALWGAEQPEDRDGSSGPQMAVESSTTQPDFNLWTRAYLDPFSSTPSRSQAEPRPPSSTPSPRKAPNGPSKASAGTASKRVEPVYPPAPRRTTKSGFATETDYAHAKTKAVKACVAFSAAGRESARNIIERATKFQFAGQINSFNRLSDEQVFQVLLETAALGGGLESEQAVLALLSKDLAQLYDGAKGHPDLVRFHGYDSETKTFAHVDTAKVKFALPDRLRPPDLEPNMRTQVGILAQYVESSPSGGPVEYLKWNFNLRDEEATRLIVRSPSFDEVLGHVLARRPRHEQDRWISRAYRDLSDRHEALRGHPAFQKYRLHPTQPRPGVPQAPRPYDPLYIPDPVVRRNIDILSGHAGFPQYNPPWPGSNGVVGRKLAGYETMHFNQAPFPGILRENHLHSPSFKINTPRTWTTPRWMR